MLTRVEISGFKSFQDFSLDLDPLFMLLGPNSAGKSNLFDALALIGRLAEMEISKALQGGRGSIRDQFSRTPDGIADQMTFAVELLVSDQALPAELAQTRFRYELTVGRKELPSGIEQLNVLHESLRPIARDVDPWMTARPAYARSARYGVTEVLIEPGTDPKQSRLVAGDRSNRVGWPRDLHERGNSAWMIYAGLPRAQKTLLSEAGATGERHISAVADELRDWRFLHLGMAALRASSERGARTRLASDGSNLPTALAALPKEARARVQADLVGLVPGAKTLQVTVTGEDLGVEVTFTDGQRYSQRVLSDGTLRLLALLTMLHSAAPGTLVALEEPENGLFPGRLRELLRRLRELVQRDDALPVQILLNGHSPAIVAGLHDRPDSMAFADLVRRKDGVRRTRVRRIAITDAADPATTISMREVDALLEAASPESAE